MHGCWFIISYLAGVWAPEPTSRLSFPSMNVCYDTIYYLTINSWDVRHLHSRRLTAWTWKWWFGRWCSLFHGCILRFHVNLPGWMFGIIYRIHMNDIYGWYGFCIDFVFLFLSDHWSLQLNVLETPLEATRDTILSFMIVGCPKFMQTLHSSDHHASCNL